MSYVGTEVAGTVGNADEGGFLRFRNADDLGIIEAYTETWRSDEDGRRHIRKTPPEEYVYIDVDELLAVVVDLHRRVKAREADLRIPSAAEAVAATGTEGAKVLSLVRADEPSGDPAP